jgi:hypothetical protein
MRKFLFFILAISLTNLFSENKSFQSFTGKIIGNKVRMRAAPNLEGAIIEKLNKEDLVLVLDEKENYFAISPPENIKLYVFKTYFTDNVTEADKVNVRLKPNLESPVLGQLSKSQTIQGNACKDNEKWLEITPPKNIHFYVSKEYVKRVGDASYIVFMQERKKEVQKLLNSAFFLAQEECKKNYSEMKMEKAISQFEAIIKGYSDFPNSVKQAKEGLSLLKDTYLQKKISYLETKANISPEEKEKVFKEVKTFEKPKPKKPATFDKKTKSLTLKMTKKMKLWISKEKELFTTWSTYHPGKLIEDFYNDQKANAISLTGTIENYDKPIRSKPGNYVLKGENIPIAYLYSTLIDLEEHIGKTVTILVSPRPNNNFAFPAYFVNAVK